MTDRINVTPAQNLVTIVIACYWKYVLAERVGGPRQRFKMANTAADFTRLIALLQSFRAPVRVGLEPNGDYHRALAHRLLSAGLECAQDGLNIAQRADSLHDHSSEQFA